MSNVYMEQRLNSRGLTAAGCVIPYYYFACWKLALHGHYHYNGNCDNGKVASLHFPKQFPLLFVSPACHLWGLVIKRLGNCFSPIYGAPGP